MARTRANIKKIAELSGKGLKAGEIASLLNVHRSTVYENLKLSDHENHQIEQFNQELPKHITYAISRIIQKLSIVDLDKMSPYQLVGMVSMLIDKQRLLTGQSTSNQHILFHLVEQACKPVVVPSQQDNI